MSTKARLLVRVVGKMADRAESAESVATVRLGTVPFAGTRTAVTESMCVLI